MSLIYTDPSAASYLIRSAKNVLILLGAGLSEPSGIPTFQESWEGYNPREMATPSFFHLDPVTSWHFYEDRRQKALQSEPNAGHRAIAQFASWNEHVLTITQNIDGLSERAGHHRSRLVRLHGSLFDVKCTSEVCNFSTTNYSPESTLYKLSSEVFESNGYKLRTKDNGIPSCQSCRGGLLRPGVVWFGEKLSSDSLERIDTWFDSVERVDLIMVVGTEASVQPAASYIHRAAEKGARVTYFNKNPLRPDQEEEMDEIDLFVQGDVAESLPSLIGYR